MTLLAMLLILHFLHNLKMGLIHLSVYQAFPTQCNISVYLIRPIHKLLKNLQMGPLHCECLSLVAFSGFV
jgi:hypothetical protein